MVYNLPDTAVIDLENAHVLRIGFFSFRGLECTPASHFLAERYVRVASQDLSAELFVD